MAKITCTGSCLNCAHRINGETQTSECASMFGFIQVQSVLQEMRQLHTEIKNNHISVMSAIENIIAHNGRNSCIEPNEFECDSLCE